MSKILNNFLNNDVNSSTIETDFLNKPENTKFLNKDDSLKVVFKYKGNPDEEIIIPKFKKNVLSILNRGIILYGPTETGKTVIMKDFLYMTKGVYPIVFAFSPTNSENHTYDSIIPKPLVFEELTLKQIKEIYIRQKTTTEIYNNANNLKTLHSLFLKVSNIRSKLFLDKLLNFKDKALKEAEAKCETLIEKKNKKDEIEEVFKDKLIKFYKQVINPNYNKLQNMELNQEEKFALRYRYLNPHILIIFDDALTEIMGLLKESKKDKDEIIKNFFFKGRHAKISHWYGFQDDNRLDSEIRKNAHISIFTDKPVALSYFRRSANGFSLVEQKKAEAVINTIFSDKSPDFAKLIYCRMDKTKFYYIVADEHDDSEVQMCSDLVKDYCNKISAKNGNFDTSNPYYNKFADF